MLGRRMVKSVVILLTLGYCFLIVYYTGETVDFQKVQPVIVDNIQFEPVTKLSIERFKYLTLDDIFISVKTTKYYQHTRLPIILKTWFQLAKEQTWFFTDTNNQIHQVQTNGHMINTRCQPSHQRTHLCCKMSVEYDHFLNSDKKWFCHFDDDNYVNIPKLVEVLQKYNHQQDWYLGKKSINEPVTIPKSENHTNIPPFWFATGGAGFCISRSLAWKMMPIASGGKFISVCEHTYLPDDVSMGFLIENILKTNLTVVNEFHSHLEPLQLLESDRFKEQISFGYLKMKDRWNVVSVPGFSVEADPSRFLSLHCFLFPNFKFCPR